MVRFLVHLEECFSGWFCFRHHRRFSLLFFQAGTHFLGLLLAKLNQRLHGWFLAKFGVKITVWHLAKFLVDVFLNLLNGVLLGLMEFFDGHLRVDNWFFELLG
jgi:hypothetical protein